MKKEALRLISILEHDMNLAHRVLSDAKRVLRSGAGLHKKSKLLSALNDFSSKRRKAKGHQYASMLKRVDVFVKKTGTKKLQDKLSKLKKFYS